MINSVLEYISPSFNSTFSGISLILILIIMGTVIGFLAGLFGVGGGFLLVPIMNILLGIPMETAAGSATCYVIGTSTTGFLKQIRNKNVEFKVFFYIALGSSTGAVLGDILQNYLIKNIAMGNKGQFEHLMLIVFFILLLIIAAIMYFSPHRDETKKVFLQKLPIGPKTNLINSGIDGISIPGLIIIGLLGGVLTGLLGISGGVLFVPILVLGVGLSSHIATGTSLGVVLVSSVSAVIKKGLSGPGKISIPITLSLLVASAIGVQTGIKVAEKLHASKLKKYFAIVVLLAAIMVLFKLI